MIISASRRTDIPAFYAEWFMNRIRAGYCAVPNPFNKAQVSRVSLAPPDVDGIVFWSRNPAPLIHHLDELDSRGFRYYFQLTLMDNPRLLDPGTPPLEEAIRTFRTLSDRVGPGRVIWRYDPVVFSSLTGPDFHQEAFGRIAAALSGFTERAVISIVDLYRTLAPRLRRLESAGLTLLPPEGPHLPGCMRALAAIAASCGMSLESCAEPLDLRPFGIKPGRCVDAALLGLLPGHGRVPRKDPNQREACGCVVSKDIGQYDTCPAGCVYCYATRSPGAVVRNRAAHDPGYPSLAGTGDGPAA